jgi:protein-tyrosine phosphatase
MRPDIHWIETPAAQRLAIMARPRAGDWLDDEIAGWREDGVDIVVSLLEAEEIDELGLRAEADLCRAQAMTFISFPISDRGVPASLQGTASLAQSLARQLSEGKAVAIHCRAGIGRSSLLAACVLACCGCESDAAFAFIEKARGLSVPDTEAQREWVAAFQKAARPSDGRRDG